MDTQTPATAPTPPAHAAAPTKAKTVKRLLSRRTGATIEELGDATDWQAHSVRAYLSGLRKKGSTIVREERRNGAKTYRIAKPTEAAEQ